MAKRCNRSGCGHDEQDHLSKEHGGCFGRQPGTGHRCMCGDFVEAFVEREGSPMKPPSVPPLRVVTPGEALPEHLQPLREASITDLDAHARRTFDAGRPLAERAQTHVMHDPGMKLFVGGKARELTELNAAANGIVTETNAEDLATGVFEMRAKIGAQANEIARLRAELSVAKDGKGARVPLIMMLPSLIFEGSDPGKIAGALRKALEELQPKA